MVRDDPRLDGLAGITSNFSDQRDDDSAATVRCKKSG
jgi:hypothetical protein